MDQGLTFTSPAFDAVSAADHPAPNEGGPCGTCAFRPGSEASRTQHTVWMAKFCVEGIRPFYCHEHPQVCRGWIAAVNLNGVEDSEDARRHREASAFAADLLCDMIEDAKEAEAAYLRQRLAAPEGPETRP